MLNVIEIVYSAVVLIATILGALTGLGGGVIIKPMFDLLGQDTAVTIGIYSAIAVFTMSIVSIFKQTKSGFSFNLKTLLSISLGSVAGGVIGELIFNNFVTLFSNTQVKITQNILLLVMLIFILIYTKNQNHFGKYRLKRFDSIFIVGLLLGVISVLSNVKPEYTHNMVQNFFDGNIEEATKMQLNALPLIKALFAEVNPIPVKAALNMLDFDFWVPRLPLTPMTTEKEKNLKNELFALLKK